MNFNTERCIGNGGAQGGCGLGMGLGLPKFTSQTTLGDKYAGIATAKQNEVIKEFTVVLEAQLLQAAEAGNRKTIFYPKREHTVHKEVLVKFMTEQGLNPVWKFDQRDGTWIELSW